MRINVIEILENGRRSGYQIETETIEDAHDIIKEKNIKFYRIVFCYETGSYVVNESTPFLKNYRITPSQKSEDLHNLLFIRGDD